MELERYRWGLDFFWPRTVVKDAAVESISRGRKTSGWINILLLLAPCVAESYTSDIMTYLDRQFEEGLRGAVHEELVNGEALFMADMAEVLSEDAIAEGVQIDFGTNRARFEQVLEVLRLKELVEHGRLDVVESLVNASGTTHFIRQDRVRAAIGGDTIATVLDFMQAEAWTTGTSKSGYKYLTNGSETAASSRVVFGKTVPVDTCEGAVTLSADEPVVAAYSNVIYTPEMSDEYGDRWFDLPGFVDKYREVPNSQPRIFQRLLEHSQDEGLALTLPQRSFGLIVSGKAGVSTGFLGARVYYHAARHYTVVNDRIVPYIDPEEAADY